MAIMITLVILNTQLKNVLMYTCVMQINSTITWFFKFVTDNVLSRVIIYMNSQETTRSPELEFWVSVFSVSELFTVYVMCHVKRYGTVWLKTLEKPDTVFQIFKVSSRKMSLALKHFGCSVKCKATYSTSHTVYEHTLHDYCLAFKI